MKLNITPGPWYIQVPFCIGNDKEAFINSHDCVCKVQKYADSHTISNANAEAIITAVNNTYHKGINPEAVPEMLEVLNKIANYNPDGNIERIISMASEIIQKATL